MIHSCSFCRSRGSSSLGRRVRAYSTPRCELRDIRDPRSVAAQSKAIGERYAAVRELRRYLALGIVYVAPKIPGG